MDRTERTCAIDRDAHILGNIDCQQQCPAHVTIVIRRLGGVERNTGLSRVIIDDVGPVQLIRAAGVTLRQHRLETVGRHINNINLMRQLRQDLGTFVGEVAKDDVLRLGFAVHDAGRALVPVGSFCPDRPEAGGVETVQFVRTGADEGVELEGHRVFDVLPDVLGHNPGTSPAIQETAMEARV